MRNLTVGTAQQWLGDAATLTGSVGAARAFALGRAVRVVHALGTSREGT